MLAMRRPEIEARQASKIGGRSEGLRDERGAGDKALGALVQLAHHKIARLQWRKAHADRDIESFGDDIDAPVGSLQLQLDRWILRHEARDRIARLVAVKRDALDAARQHRRRVAHNPDCTTEG